MAEDFHLPGGGYKKPSQLVAGHNVHWFDAAERGMGWRDMIRALTAAGVNGRGGKPLSVGTLSSALWRKRAETEDVMSRADRQARLALPEPIPESQPVRSRKASPKQGGRPKTAAGKPAALPASVSPPPKARERGSRIGCRTLPVRSMKNSRAWRSYAAVRLGGWLTGTLPAEYSESICVPMRLLASQWTATTKRK
jgi:hypothetical protein